MEFQPDSPNGSTFNLKKAHKKNKIKAIRFVKTRSSSPNLSKLARANISCQFMKTRSLCRHCLQNKWTLEATLIPKPSVLKQRKDLLDCGAFFSNLGIDKISLILVEVSWLSSGSSRLYHFTFAHLGDW